MPIANNQLIPYLILEKYLKRNYLDDIKKMDDFFQYISLHLDVEKKKIGFYIEKNSNNKISNIRIKAPYFLGEHENQYELDFFKNGEIKSIFWEYRGYSSWQSGKKDKKILTLEKSKKVKDFSNYFINYYRNISHINCRSLKTNNDYLLEIQTDCYLNKILIVLHDKNNEELYCKQIKANEEIHTFGINSQTEKKYTEEEIAKILISLKVDISSFTKEIQDELAELYIAYIGKFEKEKEDIFKEFRKIQIDRIMLAYQKIKEAVELLNDTKMDLDFDRLHIANLREIIFKNNGNPTVNGYIEFDDFFKNNMILRMLDLSSLDLANVNITYMDFSGTNIHINPQTIYNKDMSGVNATDVHFSPFFDSFDNVILNDAIINDFEAMISLDKLRSYNINTVIKKEVIRTKIL